MDKLIDLDALEALAEAATPGSWSCVATHDGLYVIQARGGGTEADAAFIAAARTAVPALIKAFEAAVARAEAAEAEVERLRDLVENLAKATFVLHRIVQENMTYRDAKNLAAEALNVIDNAKEKP